MRSAAVAVAAVTAKVLWAVTPLFLHSNRGRGSDAGDVDVPATSHPAGVPLHAGRDAAQGDGSDRQWVSGPGGGGCSTPSDSVPEGPVTATPWWRQRWLSARRLNLAVDRAVRDVATAVRMVATYAEARREEPEGDWSRYHTRAANHMLTLCRVNKGVYVKLGQHVAQLEHLVPPEYWCVVACDGCVWGWSLLELLELLSTAAAPPVASRNRVMLFALLLLFAGFYFI